jgi:hypothetical protein
LHLKALDFVKTHGKQLSEPVNKEIEMKDPMAYLAISRLARKISDIQAAIDNPLMYEIAKPFLQAEMDRCKAELIANATHTAN